MSRLRNVARKILYDPFVTRVCQNVFPPCGAILMFHKVRKLRKDSVRYNDHLSISPEFFDSLLAGAKKAGYSFLSLDELACLIENKKKFSKVLALTFDDGYKDNLTNALPIMEAHNAPGTIFCATGLMQGEVFLWWDLLEEYILQNERIVTYSGKEIPVKAQEEKERAFLAVRDELLFLPEKERNIYFERAGFTKGSCQEKCRKEMIALAELSRYKDSAIISFGCHTHTHSPCSKMDLETFAGELSHSLSLLRAEAVKINHFAYPYGDDVTEERFRDLFRENGIISCSTTFPCLVSKKSDSYFLPRIFVSEYDDFSLQKSLFQQQIQAYKRVLRRIK